MTSKSQSQSEKIWAEFVTRRGGSLFFVAKMCGKWWALQQVEWRGVHVDAVVANGGAWVTSDMDLLHQSFALPYRFEPITQAEFEGEFALARKRAGVNHIFGEPGGRSGAVEACMNRIASWPRPRTA